MRTSEEVYHWIRWDPRFDPSRFVLGINVRGAAPKRVPLPAFVPGGDIPWHRIMFVEADGELVWDRATGLDAVADAGLARDPRLLRAPHFTPGTPYAWDPAGGWRPGTTGQAGTLRVLTWNTLWDRYDADRVHTARRRPLLLTALEVADADVIALQEVENELLAMLLAAPWVRARYSVTTLDATEFGLLILSRLPVREVGTLVLGPHKAVTAITAETAEGQVVIAATHLTSDHTDNGAARRETELAALAQALADLDVPVVLAGDFNDGTGTPALTLGLRDAWSEVHGPGDQTPTFDPRANPLAALASLTGRPSRLDRVLLRGRHPATATLLGTVPATPDGLFLSDHYGLCVEISGQASLGPVLDLHPTARTALAWIPPAGLWPALQEIRHRHDPSFDRWPPHVNLLFGFVPEAAFEQAAPLLSAAATLPPFPATLQGLYAFRHRDTSTVWLDPAAGDPEPWTRLRDTLQRAFPRCRAGLPHLTVAKTRTPDRLIADLSPRLPGMSAHVGELTLLSRRGGEPMRPRATITLGTGELTWHDDPPAPPRPDPAPDIAGQLRAAVPEGVVHVAGSRRMECAPPGADLDLVLVLPGSPDPAEVASRVAALPGVAGVRQVVGARVPGLRLRAGGLPVDLVVVGSGDLDPGEAVACRTRLGEAAAVALSAVSDADAVLAAVADRPAAFTRLARQVKGWARARGLDSAPFGGLPGLAWTVLAALTVREAGDVSPEELTGRFFGDWAAWDWRTPVDLHGTVRERFEAPVAILTPSAPVRLCTEQVGAGGRDLLTQELYTAWEIAESGDLDRLLAPPPMHRRHRAWAVVEVTGDPGRFRGRVRALLTALEDAGVADCHAWPRPYQSTPETSRYAIGLGRTPPGRSELAELTAPWLDGLHGVTVTWADGGDIPTLR
ncbi:RNA repair domain-containing protein [Acrocarpospora catenulata]|uniref:RNA repair domain-containing protein n=1 Tax=Acrocarpospora catenulata TaxID=2836182 RepID=UPI001BDB021E|nr:RNA repair domain-containing protein [Acrocarpospora catenulata]